MQKKLVLYYKSESDRKSQKSRLYYDFFLNIMWTFYCGNPVENNEVTRKITSKNFPVSKSENLITTVIQEAPKKNPSFASFLKNQESRPEVATKLTSLLIVPIQRIPRYRLLLREVLSHTSHFQQDYYTLQSKF